MGPTSHTGCLVADGAVDGRLLIIDAPHPTKIDELDRIADLNQVVWLEIAVDQTKIMQVAEGRQISKM